jgi:hypothetical protein
VRFDFLVCITLHVQIVMVFLHITLLRKASNSRHTTTHAAQDLTDLDGA